MQAIVSLFLKDSRALDLRQQIIRLRVLPGPFMGLYYIGSNFLQAAGNALMSMLVSLLRQEIVLSTMLFVAVLEKQRYMW